MRLAAPVLGRQCIAVVEQAGPDVDQVGMVAAHLDHVRAAASAGALPAIAHHLLEDVDDLVFGQFVGFQAQVGDLAIQRRARRREGPQHHGRIVRIEQRAAVAIPDPRQLRVHLGAEPHHAGALGQQCAVAGIQHNAATGGQHPVPALQPFAQVAGLQVPEGRLAVLGEDGLDGATRRLDFLVEVAEGEAKACRQAPANGALAGAHRSDEHQVGSGIHGVILPGRDIAQLDWTYYAPPSGQP